MLNNFRIGRLVKTDKGLAKICGIFTVECARDIYGESLCSAWDILFEDWRSGLVLYVEYEEPVEVTTYEQFLKLRGWEDCEASKIYYNTVRFTNKRICVPTSTITFVEKFCGDN